MYKYEIKTRGSKLVPSASKSVGGSSVTDSFTLKLSDSQPFTEHGTVGNTGIASRPAAMAAGRAEKRQRTAKAAALLEAQTAARLAAEQCNELCSQLC